MSSSRVNLIRADYAFFFFPIVLHCLRRIMKLNGVTVRTPKGSNCIVTRTLQYLLDDTVKVDYSVPILISCCPRVPLQYCTRAMLRTVSSSRRVIKALSGYSAHCMHTFPQHCSSSSRDIYFPPVERTSSPSTFLTWIKSTIAALYLNTVRIIDFIR